MGRAENLAGDEAAAITSDETGAAEVVDGCFGSLVGPSNAVVVAAGSRKDPEVAGEGTLTRLC